MKVDRVNHSFEFKELEMDKQGSIVQMEGTLGRIQKEVEQQAREAQVKGEISSEELQRLLEEIKRKLRLFQNT
ncbi:hypothetical protein [Thermocrinis sp.]